MLSFGVSGLLLQNNLIMYDRKFESLWPQMRLQSDKGVFIDDKFELIPATELTWKAWKGLHPETLILSRETGFFREYTPNSIYGKYRYEKTMPIYPMEYKDTRMEAKRRVLGVYAGGSSKAYPLHYFSNKRNILNDNIGGVPIVIYADKDARMVKAFVGISRSQALTFRIVSNESDGPISGVTFRDDQTGSTWNVKGESIAGPLAGEQLQTPDSFISYWFAWSAFNRDADLWEG